MRLPDPQVIARAAQGVALGAVAVTGLVFGWGAFLLAGAVFVAALMAGYAEGYREGRRERVLDA